MLLHHFGDGAGHGLLLRRQALVEARAQPLLQEVNDELGAAHLLLVVFDPRHLPLGRQLPIKVVLREERDSEKERKSMMKEMLKMQNRESGWLIGIK